MSTRLGGEWATVFSLAAWCADAYEAVPGKAIAE